MCTGVIYALTSDGFSYREQRDYAEFIRAELLRVPNVGKVDLIGVQDEVFNIDVVDAADCRPRHHPRSHRGDASQPELGNRLRYGRNAE